MQVIIANMRHGCQVYPEIKKTVNWGKGKGL